MLVSRCPTCDESVTVPDAPPESRVRCPLCSEILSISEVLEKSPPLLELIDGPADAAPFAVAPSESVADDSMPFSFAEAPAPKAEPSQFGTASSTSPTTRGTTVARRPRRKARNPIIEIAKVVGGGVVGLSIAQLLLWWLPFNLHLSQRDPVSLGRNLAPYVPWIMPAEVRGEATGDDSAANDNSNKNPAVDRLPRDKNSPFAPENIDQKPGKPPKTTQQNSPKNNGVNTPSSTSGNSGKNAATNAGDKNRTPDAAPPGLKQIGIRSVADLEQAIEKAAAANDAYNDAPAGQRGQRANEMYVAMAELGEVLTYVDPKAGGSKLAPAVKSLESLLRGLEPGKYNGIGTLGASWQDNENRATKGIVLVGTVKEKNRLDENYYETWLELGGADKTARVLGWIDVKAVQPGARVLILGAILDDPAKQLNNYSGEEPRAICGGYLLMLEPPKKSTD